MGEGGAGIGQISNGVGNLVSRGMTYTIAAFYRFVSLPGAAGPLPDGADAGWGTASPEALREELAATFAEEELCGTLLLAPEGVNGTLAGSAEVIERLLALLEQRVGLERSEVKFAWAEERPFGRLKFRVKQEIIAFRKAVVDPARAGQYVAPQEWNRLVADPRCWCWIRGTAMRPRWGRSRVRWTRGSRRFRSS